jgi:hypothetical protein
MPLEALLFRLAQADADEIQPCLDILFARHAELFPDWEIHYLSLLKAPDRIQQIERVIALLEQLKEDP